MKFIQFTGFAYNCDKCDHRTNTCHSTCEEYLSIKAKNEALRDEKKQEERGMYRGKPNRKRKDKIW